MPETAKVGAFRRSGLTDPDQHPPLPDGPPVRGKSRHVGRPADTWLPNAAEEFPSAVEPTGLPRGGVYLMLIGLGRPLKEGDVVRSCVHPTWMSATRHSTLRVYLAGIRGIFSSAIAACHANVAMKMADSFNASSLMRSG